MDYRKPVVFGENWSPSRYRVLPYFAVEKAIFTRPGVERVLDVGCAAGWNMSRFVQYGKCPIGLDVVPERVKLARAHGPVMVASGMDLPVADGSMDLVYVQHVLHHVGDVRRVLREVWRVLAPAGTLFLVETVEDNPLIRWGRKLHPRWLDDEVTARFDFARLRHLLAEEGFQVMQAEQYSVLFWLWEVLPDRVPMLEKLTPLFTAGERVLAALWRRHSAHCYIVARPVEERSW